VSPTSQTRLDEQAAADVVIAYARALDSRDWSMFQSLFEDEVEIDYSSLGTTVGRFLAKAWADRCRVLGGFDATHHKVCNFTFAQDGDGEGMVVRSYVDAAHFIQADGRTLEAYVLGLYQHHLVRRGSDWRIAKCVLTVAGYPGGREAFTTAFAAARTAFAAR
jgi:hypothetical protein